MTQDTKPEEYSPYKSNLARAIERGEGLAELDRQIDHFSDSFANRIESLGSKQGWQDLLELLKSESSVPFALRKKNCRGAYAGDRCRHLYQEQPQSHE
ncbi:MAG: hypothetical protein LRZ85_08425 [Alphaproteobacteria bacterium]|nr:hypothetical protein [Alphaproteobacteria bacterium]